jgi:ferritin-like protein
MMSNVEGEKRLEAQYEKLAHQLREYDAAAVMREPILQFFQWAHLPTDLAEISVRFSEVAYDMEQMLPPNPERMAMLRKLLEAKDCAVRARLYR